MDCEWSTLRYDDDTPDVSAKVHNDIHNKPMSPFTVSSVTSRMLSCISTIHMLKADIKYFKRTSCMFKQTFRMFKQTSRIDFLSDKKAFNTEGFFEPRLDCMIHKRFQHKLEAIKTH